MADKKFSLLAALLLAALTAVLFPPGIFSETGPDLRGFDRSLFDYHLDRADRAVSPDLWMNEARRGISLARSAWERIAAELYPDPAVREEAERQIAGWGEKELEARFSEWLLNRFFKGGMAAFAGNLAAEVEDANLRYTYHLDAGGGILFDGDTGDPLLIRPGDGGRDFSVDRELWRLQTGAALERESAACRSELAALFPGLLQYIPEEDREEFEKVLELNAGAVVSDLRREFEEIINREERLFTARRLGDIWSLRRKSEDETAEMVSARIIRDVETLCDEGIARLAARIEAAEAGAGDLAIAGAEWLDAYREQFDRGLKAWEAAEERFFIRRIEWEQEAGRTYLEGEAAWSAAFGKFEEGRREWELRAKSLFDSGDLLFRKASETLETAIAEAKAEFDRDAQVRITAGTERARAWVDMYVTTGAVVAGAQENVDFWLKTYGAGKAPPLSDAAFTSWLTGEMTKFWRETGADYKRRHDFSALEEAEKAAAISHWEVSGKYQQLLAEKERLDETMNQRTENSSRPAGSAEYDRLMQEINELEPWVNNYAAMHTAALDRYREQLSWFKQNHRLYYDIEDALAGKFSIVREEALIQELKQAGLYVPNRSDAIMEIKKWLELYKRYIVKAVEARDALVNDFTLVMGSGGLADILAEGVSSEDFNLDEYQIELIRAKAAAGYWAKRTAIAGSVLAYAEEISAGRMTDSEGVKAWEEAKRSYDTALAAYEAAQIRFASAGAETGEAQAALNGASMVLREADKDLDRLNQEYAILMAAYAAGRSDFILEEMASKYTDLIKEHKLLSDTGTGAAYVRYLERARELGFAQDLERSGEILKLLVAGDYNGEKSLAALWELASAITVPAGDGELPSGPEACGLSPDNPYFTVIRDLMAERDSRLAAGHDPAGAEKIREDYGKVIITLIRAAKEQAERDLSIRLAGLSLLTANSLEDWYASVYRAGDDGTREPVPAGGTVEERLRFDAERGRRDLLKARIDLELGALNYFCYGIAGGEDAETLASLCRLDRAGVPAAIEMLEMLSSVCAGLDGTGAAEYARVLEGIAGENLSAGKFVRGESFFGGPFNAIVTESFLGSRAAAGKWSEALLPLYLSIGSQTPAGKRAAGEQAIRGLRDLFASRGIELNGDAVLPGIGLMGKTLGKDGHPGKNTAAFLIETDQLFESLPPWLASELRVWENALIEYMAARTVYAGMAVTGTAAGILDEIKEAGARKKGLDEIYDLLSLAVPGSARTFSAVLKLDAGGSGLRDFALTDRNTLEQETVYRIGRELADLHGMAGTEGGEILRSDIVNTAARYYGYTEEGIRDRAVEEAVKILNLRNVFDRGFDPSVLTGYEREVWQTRLLAGLGLDSTGGEPAIPILEDFAGTLLSPAAGSILFLLDELPALVRRTSGMDGLMRAIYDEPSPSGPSWLARVYAAEGDETGGAVEALLGRAFSAGHDDPSLVIAFLQDELTAELESAVLFINTIRTMYDSLGTIVERMLSLLIASRTDRLSYTQTLLDQLGLSAGNSPEQIYALSRDGNFDFIRDSIFFDHPAALEAMRFRLKYFAYSGGGEIYRDEAERWETFISSREDPLFRAAGKLALEEAENYARLFTLGRSYLGPEISGDPADWAAGQDIPGKPGLVSLILTGHLQDPFTAGLEWDRREEGGDPWVQILTYEINRQYRNLLLDEDRLNYEYAFIASYEQMIKAAASAEQEGKKHWRQFISAEFLADYNKAREREDEKLPPGTGGSPEGDYRTLKAAAGWNEGVLAGLFNRAERETEKANAAFALYAAAFSGEGGTAGEDGRVYLDNPLTGWDESFRKNVPYILYDNYYYESGELQRHAAFEEALEQEIERLGSGYELTKQGMQVIQREMERKSTGINIQEGKYKEAAEGYSTAARAFQDAGGRYDAVYGEIKDLYLALEDARFSYETQDAIRRWASTAYMGSGDRGEFQENPWQSPGDELTYSRNRLDRANIALAALTNLYNNGESRRPYDSAEYERLYREYEESFKRMMLSMKARDSLERAIRRETETNNALYNSYRNQLNDFGKPLNISAAYRSPEDRQSWKVSDLVTIKDGRLGLAYDGNFTLYGMTGTGAAALEEFFRTDKAAAGEIYKVSRFEEALRGLGARLQSYNMTSEKYRQFGLARDFLIRLLKDRNPEIRMLKNLYTAAEPLRENQNLGKMPIKENLMGLQSDTQIYEVADRFLDSLYEMQAKAWDSLSSTERADLEFYIILTLSGGGGGSAGSFSRISQLEEFKHIKEVVDDRYEYVNWRANIPVVGLAWTGARNKIRATRNALESPYKELVKTVENGVQGLNGTLGSLGYFLSAYKKSSERLLCLRGDKTGSETTAWTDLSRALKTAGDLSAGELGRLEGYWNKMPAGDPPKNNTEALRKLVQWARSAKEDDKRDFENRWSGDEQIRRADEKQYREIYESYIQGTADLEELNRAAVLSYGGSAAAWKNHLENLERVIMNDLGGVMENGSGYGAEYAALTGEYTGLIRRVYAMRYNAELAAREGEWEQQRRDIEEKHKIWRESSTLILEYGRTDWKDGTGKLRNGFAQWKKRYEEEYKQANSAWSAAYLAGLEDKETWVARATDTANRASSEAMLAMTGAGAEAMARAMDTRDPAAMTVPGGADGAGALLSELLGSAGIMNMGTAFASMNGISGTVSVQVRRGIGGPGVWNTGLVQAEAAKMARETNAELAAREAKKIAAHAQQIMTEALRDLRNTVDDTNAAYRENFDDTFIVQGQWRRSGKNYIKDVIVHSTLFDPVITESASVEGYQDYRMEPVNLVTDLSENRLRDLNALAIQALIDNMFREVKAVSEDVFGTDADMTKEGLAARTKTENRIMEPGKIGIHLGYTPLLNTGPGAGDSRDAMIREKGSGELGRLMTEYFYWLIQEGQGIGKMSAAPWDKPLWDSRESFFDAPTIRTVADIGIQITAAALIPVSGGLSAIAATAVLNLVDDAVFGLMDVGGGFKTIDEAGFEFGKKVIASAAGAALGGTFNGISGMSGGFFGEGGLTGIITSKTGDGLIGVAARTALSGVEAFSNMTVNSLLGAVTYDRDNGLKFSGESFRAGLESSVKALPSSLTATLTGGILGLGNTGFTGNLYRDSSALSRLAGGLAGQGVNYAVRGEASFNLLSTSLFANLLPGGGFPQGGSGMGLLELHLGRNSVKMNLGTGGASLSPDTLAGAVKGLEAWKVNLQMLTSDNPNARTYASPMRTLYTGSAEDRAAYEDILSGKTVVQERRARIETESVYDEESKIKTIYLGSNALDEGSRFGLNVVFSHESYRDGINNGEEGQKIERDNAVRGHIGTELRLIDTYGAGSIGQTMAAEAQEYVRAVSSYDLGGIWNIYDRYDTGADYWLLRTDGVVEDDDSPDLQWQAVTKRSFDGKSNYKTIWRAPSGMSKEESLVELVGGREKALALLEKKDVLYKDPPDDDEVRTRLYSEYTAVVNGRKTLALGYSDFRFEKDWRAIYQSYTTNEAFFKRYSLVRGDRELLKKENQGYVVGDHDYLEYYAILYEPLRDKLKLSNTTTDPLSYLRARTVVFEYPGWQGSIRVDRDMIPGLTVAFAKTKFHGGSLPKTDGGLVIRFQSAAKDGKLELSEHALGRAVDFDAAHNGIYYMSSYSRTDPAFNSYLERNLGMPQDEVKGWYANQRLTRLYAEYANLMDANLLDANMPTGNTPTGSRVLQQAFSRYGTVYHPNMIVPIKFSMEREFVENMRQYFEWGGDWSKTKDYMHFEMR